MNREEILEKSRKEKQDEGMLNAENRGRKLGMVAFCIVFIAIMLINFCTGHSNPTAGNVLGISCGGGLPEI